MNTDFLKHFEKKIKDIKQKQEQGLFLLTSFENDLREVGEKRIKNILKHPIIEIGFNKKDF